MAGRAQVDAAYAALAEVGADDVTIVGMAKSIERESGREHFCRHGQPPFRLDEKSPVLYFLQRLRDEAHRFAIGGHRKKRSKAIGASPLDEIAGVGRARKKALLSHFGSARAVAQASLADLAVGPGRELGPCPENLRILPSGVGFAASGFLYDSAMSSLPNAPDHHPDRAHAAVCGGVFTFRAMRTLRWVAFALFVLAAITDAVDGMIARRWQAESSLGRMLDPIADKLIVAAALSDAGLGRTLEGVNLIPALVILCREILVSDLREFLAEAAVSACRSPAWQNSRP